MRRLTCNGVESHCIANGVLVHLSTKYSLMELKNGTSIAQTRRAVGKNIWNLKSDE